MRSSPRFSFSLGHPPSDRFGSAPQTKPEVCLEGKGGEVLLRRGPALEGEEAGQVPRPSHEVGVPGTPRLDPADGVFSPRVSIHPLESLPSRPSPRPLGILLLFSLWAYRPSVQGGEKDVTRRRRENWTGGWWVRRRRTRDARKGDGVVCGCFGGDVDAGASRERTVVCGSDLTSGVRTSIHHSSVPGTGASRHCACTSRDASGPSPGWVPAPGTDHLLLKDPVHGSSVSGLPTHPDQPGPSSPGAPGSL